MKKFTILMAMLLALSTLTGCGGEAAPAETTAPPANVTVDLQAIYNSMTTVENAPEMLPLDADMQFNFCGINPADCTQSIAAICANSLRADEIWLIEAADEAALERIQSAAQTRLTAKDEESITYSPEQNAIVKQAVTITHGNYFVLVVSPDVDALAEIFRTAAGI